MTWAAITSSSWTVSGPVRVPPLKRQGPDLGGSDAMGIVLGCQVRVQLGAIRGDLAGVDRARGRQVALHGERAREGTPDEGQGADLGRSDAVGVVCGRQVRVQLGAIRGDVAAIDGARYRWPSGRPGP